MWTTGRRRGAARGLPSTVVAACGVLALAGCAAGPPDAVLPVAPRSVSVPGASSGGSPAQGTTEPGGLAPGDTISPSEFMTRLRVAQEGHPAVRMRVTVSGLQELRMDAEMDTRDGQKIRARMQGPEIGELGMLAIGDQVWVEMPDVWGEDVWFELDDEQADDMGVEDTVKDLKYDEMWRAWDVGSTAIKYVGASVRGGEQRYHYAVSVDLADAREAQGEPVPPLAPDTVLYDVYLDENDLMREVSFEVFGMTGEVSLSEWGEQDFGIEEPEDAFPLPS